MNPVQPPVGHFRQVEMKDHTKQTRIVFDDVQKLYDENKIPSGDRGMNVYDPDNKANKFWKGFLKLVGYIKEVNYLNSQNQPGSCTVYRVSYRKWKKAVISDLQNLHGDKSELPISNKLNVILKAVQQELASKTLASQPISRQENQAMEFLGISKKELSAQLEQVKHSEGIYIDRNSTSQTSRKAKPKSPASPSLLEKAKALGATDEELQVASNSKLFSRVVIRCEMEKKHRDHDIPLLVDALKKQFGKEPIQEEEQRTIVENITGRSESKKLISEGVMDIFTARYLDRKKYSLANYEHHKKRKPLEGSSFEKGQVFIEEALTRGMNCTKEQIIAALEAPDPDAALKKLVSEAPARTYGFSDQEIAEAASTPGGLTKLIRQTRAAEHCVSYCKSLEPKDIGKKILTKIIAKLRAEGKEISPNIEKRILNFNCINEWEYGHFIPNEETDEKVKGKLLLRIAEEIKLEVQRPDPGYKEASFSRIKDYTF